MLYSLVQMRTIPFWVIGCSNVCLVAALAAAFTSGCGGEPSRPTAACRTDDDCSDHVFCNGVESCKSGQCAAGTPIVCKALDACHAAGVCTEDAGSCTNPVVADGKTCDDGSACTTADACVAGECKGTAVVCAAADACHEAGTCNPTTGACTSVPRSDGSTCDDGNACTKGDACETGVCKGTPVLCTAADACHEAGTCDATTGACSLPLRPDGSTCDDGNACTTGDACATGVCKGTPIVCSAADACHEAGACDPTSGTCTSPLRADGSTCDDGDACTTADTCSAGACRGAPVICTAADACHQAGVCDPSSGSCTSPRQPDGSPCDDADACTKSDGCVAGVCQGTSVVCMAADACHQAGTCDPSSGACTSPRQPDGTTCDDGNPCTTSDACVTGACAGNLVVCPAADSCHLAGACIPATGLCEPGAAKSDGADCDDGNPCSSSSACTAGACIATGMAVDGIECDDKNTCSRTSTCQSGLCKAVASEPDDTPCSDGSPCSVIDTCRAGICVGNHAPFCSDGVDACAQQGSCSPVCGDSVLAATEACEKSGGTGGCTADCKLDVTPIDYDVSGVGSVFAVYQSNNTLTGRCFGPNGAARGPGFEIAVGPAFGPQVVTASTSGTSLVSYVTSTGTNTKARMSRLYDAACAPVGPAFPWETSPGSDSAFDAAIDANGNFALLWTDSAAGSAYIAFYDDVGAPLGTKLIVDSAGRCTSSYGMRVVLSPSSGAGVVTCQGHASDPIYYRRFHDGAFTDATMLEVPGTLQRSSWYQSHSVAINDAGDFLIVWQNYARRAYEAALFSSLLGDPKSFTLGWAASSGYDGFPRGTRSIQLHGSDFAVMDGEAPHAVRLVSPSGEIRGCDYESGSLLRTGGLELNYTINAGIQRDSVDFSSWNGCTRPTCGNGNPDPGEECDDGNRDSFDGCNEFCKSERCGDGLVTDGESCDEGDLLPTSTCDSTCRWTADVQAVTDAFPAGSLDFDVASDGTFIATQIFDNRVWALCYGSDRKPLRQAFPVSPQNNYESAQAVMAWGSKRALVAWLEDQQIWGALLDDQCKRVGPPRRLISEAIDHEAWEVAMDGAGRFAAVAKASDRQVNIAFFDETGAPMGSEHISSFDDALYAPRMAMNRLSGGGVVTVQNHSGPNAVYYRRFDAAGSWIDPGFVTVPVSYVYWYAGYTVGMNELGDFVIVYRAENGSMQAVFYGPDAVANGPITFSTRARTDDTLYYDSFRGYRSPIPLKGNDFVLGEVYRNASIAAERTTTYYVYTPSGSVVSSYESQWSDGKLTARMDGNGVSYILESGTVYFGTGRL